MKFTNDPLFAESVPIPPALLPTMAVGAVAMRRFHPHPGEAYPSQPSRAPPIESDQRPLRSPARGRTYPPASESVPKTMEPAPYAPQEIADLIEKLPKHKVPSFQNLDPAGSFLIAVPKLYHKSIPLSSTRG